MAPKPGSNFQLYIMVGEKNCKVDCERDASDFKLNTVDLMET